MASCAAAVLAVGRVLPTGQLGFAAIASLFAAAAAVELGCGWGLGVWAVSSAAALLLLPGGSAGLLFAAFFGYYPVVKLLAERQRRRAAEWGIKLAGFGLGAAAVYAAARLFGITLLGAAAGEKLRALLPLAAVAAVAVFVVFDIGCSKLLAFYMARLSRRR
jgi:hypothetical protein